MPVLKALKVFSAEQEDLFFIPPPMTVELNHVGQLLHGLPVRSHFMFVK